MLTFKLFHQFNQTDHAAGRFRISVTNAKGPVGISLPEELAAIVVTPADQRTSPQQATLLNYYRAIDSELRRRQTELADSKKPLPTDPRVLELRGLLELVSKPVPPNALLMQLRQDMKMSEQQMANPRLTGAQDITWALINSPAFLFNH